MLKIIKLLIICSEIECKVVDSLVIIFKYFRIIFGSRYPTLFLVIQ